MEAKRERINLKGIVTGEIKSGISRSSVPYLRFYLKVEDSIYENIAYNDVASDFKTKLKPDILVLVRGFFKDIEAKASKIITINTISLSDNPASKQETIIKEFGSIDKYKDSLLARANIMKANGFVWVAEIIDGKECYRWLPIDRCYLDKNNKWWSKIDWLMNELGAETVHAELRKFSSKISGTALNNPNFAKEYKAKIEELIANAQYFNGEHIPASENYEFDYAEI